MTKSKTEMVEEIKHRLSYNDEPDVAKDVAEHGADAGFGEFTYTKDCVAFYEEYEEAIWEMLSEQADSLGETVPAMIADFGRVGMADTPDGFKNLLVWFALEEVCRELVENPPARNVKLYGLYTDGSGNRVSLELVEEVVDSLLTEKCCYPYHDQGIVEVEEATPEELETLLTTHEDEQGNEFTIEEEDQDG